MEWVGKRKTNADLFTVTYKSTLVPVKCTATQLGGIFQDLC